MKAINFSLQYYTTVGLDDEWGTKKPYLESNRVPSEPILCQPKLVSNYTYTTR